MSENLTERDVALVTGGSRGIGLAVARELLAGGAIVAITARGEEGLDKAAAQLRGEGFDDVMTVVAHSDSEEQIKAAFDVVQERHGVVNLVCNNAATNPVMAHLIDTDPAIFDKIMGTNLRGYFLVAREAALRMKADGFGEDGGRSGAIVNVSTVGSFRHMKGLGAYGVSKAAINQLTRALAAELAPVGIRVNGVAPGLVRTAFSEALWKDPAVEKKMLRGIPAGRIGEPDEIARVVTFLLSSAASYITGEIVVADGGLLTI